jgi:hypothetical protein
MDFEDFLKAGAIAIGVYLALEWVARQPWCGPACQRFVAAGENQVAQAVFVDVLNFQ